MSNFFYQAEEQKSKNPNAIRVWLIIMTVAFIAAAIWGYWQYRDKQEMTAFLENEYQRSFYTLVRSANTIDGLMGKAMVSNDPQHGLSLMNDLQQQSFTVVSSLSTLPLESESLVRVSSYFNQLGDYASTLADKLAAGQSLSSEDQEQLNNIRAKIQEVEAIVTRLEAEIANGNLALITDGRTPLQGAIVEVAGELDDASMDSPMNYFSEMQDRLSLEAEMNYDGAYSIHMSERVAKSLVPGEDVGREAALQTASEFAQLMAGEGWQLAGESQIGINSAIPAYAFDFSHPDQEQDVSLRVVVSKSGGKVISAYNSRSATESETPMADTDILAKIDELFAAAGYPQMELISRKTDNNRLILKYAATDGEILYYPDSVQITAAQDTGEVLAFWAQEYWMNTSERDLEDPQITAEDAQGGLHSALSVDSGRLVLVMDEAGKEILCHEFRAKNGEEEYMVYIDGTSGNEHDILSRMTTEDGGFYTR